MARVIQPFLLAYRRRMLSNVARETHGILYMYLPYPIDRFLPPWTETRDAEQHALDPCECFLGALQLWVSLWSDLPSSCFVAARLLLVLTAKLQSTCSAFGILASRSRGRAALKPIVVDTALLLPLWLKAPLRLEVFGYMSVTRPGPKNEV